MVDPNMVSGPPPLAILVHDDMADRVHYALVMASSAAAMNRRVTLFCAGRAVWLLSGTAAEPGWRALAATGAGQTAHQFDSTAKHQGGAGFETLLQACRELGVEFLCCELAARLARLEMAQLRPELTVEIAGAATFLAQASGGQMVNF